MNYRVICLGLLLLGLASPIKAHDRKMPWSGTNEDPVTGGTHTFLARYWSSRLGKTKMRSFQASKRTGFMEVELKDEKLQILGQAVIVFEGSLAI